MFKVWLQSWIRFSMKHPYAVVFVTLALNAVLGYEAVSRFAIRSDIADLLPEDRERVSNHRWVQAHTGAPEIIEAILMPREPEPDRLLILEGPGEGTSRDIGQVTTTPEGMTIRFRSPLFSEDGSYEKVRFGFLPRAGDQNAWNHIEFSGELIQKGKNVQFRVAPTPSSHKLTMEELTSRIRAGDPNGDGRFEIDHAKKALRILARKLTDLSMIDYAIAQVPIRYFQENAVLFAPKSDLQLVKCCIVWKQKEAIRRDMGINNDADSAIEDEEEEEEDDDPFLTDSKPDADPDCANQDISEDTCTFERISTTRGVIRNIPEYFISKLGYLAIFIKPSSPSTDFELNRTTQRDVRAMVQATLLENNEELGRSLDPESLQLGGGYVYNQEQILQTRRDLGLSVIITVALLFFIIIFYFRRTRALWLVLLPLILGVLCSLGLTFLTIGYLNIITAFIFAILLGLGVDFGVHIMNRYVEERAIGKSIEEALMRALGSTGFATSVGALTTTITFLTLSLTSFRGFSQFGIIAGMGVPLCLFFVFILLPPLTQLFERWRPVKWVVRGTGHPGKEPRLLQSMLKPKNALRVTMVVSGIGLLSLIGVNTLEFEYDTRNAKSINPRMEAVQKNKSGSTSGLPLSPGIALAKSQSQANTIYRTFRQVLNTDKQIKLLRKHGGLSFLRPRLSTVKAVISASRLIPEEQPEKLRLACEIHTLLRKKRDFLDDSSKQKYVDQLMDQTRLCDPEACPGVLASGDDKCLQPIAVDALDPSIRRFFDEKPRALSYDVDPLEPQNILAGFFRWMGVHQAEVQTPKKRRHGTFVYVFPGSNMYDVRNNVAYTKELESLRIVESAPSGKTTESKLILSSSHVIFADVFEVVKEDGIKACSIAFYTVFILVLLYFAFLARTRRRYLLALITAPLPIEIYLLQSAGYIAPMHSASAFILAAIGVFLLVMLIDRQSAYHACLVLAPLALSFVILLASMGIIGWRINFYNMIVFPIILGIGVDSGIHIYHRFIEDGEHNILNIVRHTGVTIGVATLTTSIGFGAMLVANHLGLQSIGKAALLGLSITFVNAVVFLPCLLRVLMKYNRIPEIRRAQPTDSSVV
ncbi:MAG: hypothetical protein CMH54_01120 [Myxococcales bacterium]|nr:hypothetical protein [Myxococcales bacterium]